MTRAASGTADEAAIRGVIDAITAAVRAKDVDAMLAHCSRDIVTFDMVPPLAHEGVEAVRRVWTRTLAPFEAPLEHEVHRLDLVIAEDAAFARSLNRFGGTRADGGQAVGWVRSTLGFRRIGGSWKLVHQHVSVPFDMETGEAMVSLRP